MLCRIRTGNNMNDNYPHDIDCRYPSGGPCYCGTKPWGEWNLKKMKPETFVLSLIGLVEIVVIILAVFGTIVLVGLLFGGCADLISRGCSVGSLISGPVHCGL